MDALEYMKRQKEKHMLNLERAHPNTPPDHLANIEAKIGYYSEAIDALEKEN